MFYLCFKSSYIFVSVNSSSDFIECFRYLGASFDIASLVERLLQQLASKQTIIVDVYDTTNSSAAIKMYGLDDVSGSGEVHVSNVDFGDPTRQHAMHCR